MTIRLKRLMYNIRLIGPGEMALWIKSRCRLDGLTSVAGTHLKVEGEN